MAQSKLSLPFLILVLIGCTTTSNEMTLTKIKADERIYVGRIKVNFDKGTAPSLKCEVYVNRDLVPTLRLSPDGSVFYKTNRDKIRFTRLACYHQQSFYYAAWHHQNLSLSTIVKPEDLHEAVYFGDIHVDWKIDPTASVAAAQLQPLSTEPTRVGHVHDSGELRVKVLSDFAVMERIFFEKVENAQDLGFVLKERLVEVK